MHFAKYVDEVLGHCVVRRAFDEAPKAPIAETPTVSTFNGRFQVNPLSLDDLIALREMDVSPRNPFFIPARFAERGFAPLGSPIELRWMKAAENRMRSGRTCVRSVGLSPNPKKWVRAPRNGRPIPRNGRAVMVVRVVFVTNWCWMVAPQVGRFSLRFNGA